MGIDITLSLDDSSLHPFRQALAALATSKSIADKCRIATRALSRYRGMEDRPLPDYVRIGLSRIPDLAALLTREDWPLSTADTARLAGALAYFCDPDGLIPDRDPRFGLLDDVIVLEIALADCRHDWLAWREYREFVAQHREVDALGRDEWLRERNHLIDNAARRGEPASYLAPPLDDAFHREAHTYLDQRVKAPFAVH